MTAPALAVTRPDGSRVYRHPVTGEEVPSVTTVIKAGIPKPKITQWAARKAAEFAVANWNDMSDLSVTEKVDMIRFAHEKIANDAAGIGDAVHETIDAWNKGEQREVTKGTSSFLDQFTRFVFDKQPRFIENEVTLWSRTHGYAGTADWIAEIGGKVILGDNKTGKGVYAETALQLSALAGCDFIIREDGTEEALPEVEILAALHIRPRSWKLVRIEHQEESFEAFLSCLNILTWTGMVAPYVLEAW